jgi:hypothetical protein
MKATNGKEITGMAAATKGKWITAIQVFRGGSWGFLRNSETVGEGVFGRQIDAINALRRHVRWANSQGLDHRTFAAINFAREQVSILR